MKNKKFYISVMILFLSIILIGCKDRKTFNDVVSVIYYTNTGSAEIVANKIDTNFDLIKGDKIPKPEDPVAFGAAFLGWYRDINYTTEWLFDENTIEGSMVLYAKWQLSDFQITYNFDSQGGQLIDESVDTYSALNIVVLPKADRIGSNFRGWILTPLDQYKIGDPIITSTRGYAKNLDLYAFFEYKEFIVRFNALGIVNNPRTQTILYNSNISLSELNDTDDKKFIGWFTKNGTETNDWGQEVHSGDKYTFTNDLTLYAKWENK